MSTASEPTAGHRSPWLRYLLLAGGGLAVVLIASAEPIAFVVLAVASLLPASLAARKGRDALGWWIGGVIAWLPALVLVLLARNERRRCPACGAGIEATATACGGCGTDVTADAAAWRARPPERLLGFRALALVAAALLAFLLLLAFAAELR